MGLRKGLKLSRDSLKNEIIRNTIPYRKYREDVRKILLSCFKWNNLPSTMNERMLETCLLENGSALVLNDEIALALALDDNTALALPPALEGGSLGLINLSCLPDSSFDIYGEPFKRRGYSRFNSYSVERDRHNSVIVWNNNLHTNSLDIIEYYACELARIDLTIALNLNAQKTPFMLYGSDKQQLTLKNVYAEYDTFAPDIYVDKNFDINQIKVLNTSTPFIADKLYEIKEKLWNEMLMEAGVTSIQYQKNERMVKDEVMRNLGGTMVMRNSRLEERITACTKINKMFGTDISVEFNEGVLADYGELHNGSTDDM